MGRIPDRAERLREAFRHHYYSRHGIRLDDELVLLLIRMSEMHRDLRREIRRSPRVAFRHGRDYFWYGFGRWAGLAVLGWALAATLACVLRA